MMKLLITLHKFVNIPKNGLFHIKNLPILNVYATYNCVLEKETVIRSTVCSYGIPRSTWGAIQYCKAILFTE